MNSLSFCVNIPVVINDNKLVFVFSEKYLLKSGLDSEKHSHSFYEAHYFIEGQGKVSLENGSVDFCEGTLLIVAPEKYHLQKHISKTLVKFNFKFSAVSLRNKEDKIVMPLLELIEKDGFLHIAGAEELVRELSIIENELENAQKGNCYVISNMLAVILVKLSRHCCNGLGQKACGKKENIPVGTTTIIDNFFEQNYDRKAEIDELCSLVHLSRSQLSRTVKAMYGMTFKEKHSLTRLNFMQHLLKSEELSIAEISQKCGFDSASGFSSFFKNLADISPSQFRKQTKV